MKTKKKGKKHTQRTKEKISKSIKFLYKNGRVVWNKGLNKEIDKRVKKYIENGRKTRIGKPQKRREFIKKSGYVFIRKNTKNYEKRCNIIWFNRTGEKIKKPYIIHHKDGNRLNDNFENLEKINQKFHNQIHRNNYMEKKYGENFPNFSKELKLCRNYQRDRRGGS